jgi:hypothetical protein
LEQQQELYGLTLKQKVNRIYFYEPPLNIKIPGTFKSAALVIRDEMTNEQKERLCHHIVEAFRNFDVADLAMLIPLLSTNTAFQTIALKKVVEFLTDEMRMQIVD